MKKTFLYLAILAISATSQAATNHTTNSPAKGSDSGYGRQQSLDERGNRSGHYQSKPSSDQGDVTQRSQAPQGELRSYITRNNTTAIGGKGGSGGQANGGNGTIGGNGGQANGGRGGDATAATESEQTLRSPYRSHIRSDKVNQSLAIGGRGGDGGQANGGNGAIGGNGGQANGGDGGDATSTTTSQQRIVSPGPIRSETTNQSVALGGDGGNGGQAKGSSMGGDGGQVQGGQGGDANASTQSESYLSGRSAVQLLMRDESLSVGGRAGSSGSNQDNTSNSPTAETTSADTAPVAEVSDAGALATDNLSPSRSYAISLNEGSSFSNNPLAILEVMGSSETRTAARGEQP